MRPTLQDDESAQYWAQQGRIERVEKSGRIAFVAAAASIIELGNFDGENIAGVRITFSGFINVTGGGPGYLMIRPNGITPITGQYATHLQRWDLTTATAPINANGNNATIVGMPIAIGSAFTSSGNTQIWGEGVLHTPHGAGATFRVYHGHLANVDVTNTQRYEQGNIYSRWADLTTDIKSLTIATLNGAFTGRITAEAI